MDEDLNRLRREVEVDRENRAAAIRYEAALQRGGRRDDLGELYRFEFKCPKQWTDLKPTSDPLVRDCGACQRKVHFATGPAEFQAHVAAGRCVAVLESRADARLLELAATPGQHVQEQGRRPCVVPGDLVSLFESLGNHVTVGIGDSNNPAFAARMQEFAERGRQANVVREAVAADLGVTRGALAESLGRAYREQQAQKRRRRLEEREKK